MLYGTVRDLLIGVTVVRADGTVAKAGGKVVKNVAGYDLGKLVCGSRGTLALIVRVSLRLHPLPQAARTVVVETDDSAAVTASLLSSPLQPSALDILHPGRVALLFEGSAAAVDDQIRRTRVLVGGEEAHPRVWDEVRERQLAALGRVRFDPGRLGETLARIDEAIARPAAGVAYIPVETASDLPDAVRALNERIRARFDPTSVFVGRAW